MRRLSCMLLFCCYLVDGLCAENNFLKGPVFVDYGENALVSNGLQKPEEQRFKVVFDVSEGAEPGALNRRFNTVARFINMHVRAGVPRDNIKAALVVHGKASYELMRNKPFEQRFGRQNISSDLLERLIENNVAVQLCGQSAAHLGITSDSLIDGVVLSLSAITANALLQQQGYTLNPF